MYGIHVIWSLRSWLAQVSPNTTVFSGIDEIRQLVRQRDQCNLEAVLHFKWLKLQLSNHFCSKQISALYADKSECQK